MPECSLLLMVSKASDVVIAAGKVGFTDGPGASSGATSRSVRGRAFVAPEIRMQNKYNSNDEPAATCAVSVLHAMSDAFRPGCPRVETMSVRTTFDRTMISL